MVALVGLVAGVLLIAGAGSLVLTRNAARTQATQQLVSEAQALTSGKGNTQSLAVLRVVRRTLKLEDARLIRVTVLGTISSALPNGITASNLDPQSLLVGRTVSGRDGGLVFAAAPVQLSPTERARLKLRGQIAIVLTRQVGDLGPSWGYFIIAGGVALLIAALVAWQMSRRMSRPLIEAMEATYRLGRPREPGAHSPGRLHGVLIPRALHQCHGAEPGGWPDPGTANASVGLARSADTADVDPGIRRSHQRRCG
jgi:hypothetical protein